MTGMAGATSTQRDGAIGAGERRLIVVLMLAAAVLIAAYWITWFLVDRSLLASDTRAGYFEFENAFPLADGWLALCLCAASAQLLRRRASAIFWLLAGGGAGLYLFGMDTLYDLQHGIWFNGNSSSLVELAINILTLAGSVGLLAWSWWRRETLLAGR